MDCSRRGFVAIGGVAAAAAGAGIVTGAGEVGARSIAQAAEGSQPDDSGTDAAATSEDAEEGVLTNSVDQSPRTAEYPIPDEEPLQQTAYDTDVLVVGCGYAGLNAAVSAYEAGVSVLVVDKGYPGFSGMSSWGGSTNHFDDQTDRDKLLRLELQANEYLENQNWMDVWCDESPAYAQRIAEWGLTQEYASIADTPYHVDGVFDGEDGHDDDRGYRQSADVASHIRQPLFEKVLEDRKIPFLDHTMVVDVIEAEGRVVGAVAMHVPSGTVVTIRCKAAILCCGNGVIKPSGFPMGGGTFDAVAIGYEHGLAIAGMEFEGYELAWGYKPGCPLSTRAGGEYLAPFAVETPGITSDTADDDLWGNGFSQQINFDPCVYGTDNPDPTSASWKLPGAAPGMTSHMMGGIYNGWDDTYGKTSLPGLYCAGDGSYASGIGGACYAGIAGITTSGCSIQGWRAAEDASEYCATVELTDLPQDDVDQVVEHLQAPLSREKGFSPVWVNQQLLNAMGQTALFVKTQDSLTCALTQVDHIRDNYLPLLRAASSHDLRLCVEVEHKVTACELKLRLGLERKESRGLHYRADFPYRDDSMIGMFTITKTAEDPYSIAFDEVPEQWKGDLEADYAQRYPGYHFPGEAEALGITFPEKEQAAGGIGSFAGRNGSTAQDEEAASSDQGDLADSGTTDGAA
ncbi:MAG: FAD-binding protein [Coriobacteriales bacterium]|jgi:succinate dehydrogenase/fumarate reductase flavoprotein subunit